MELPEHNDSFLSDMIVTANFIKHLEEMMGTTSGDVREHYYQVIDNELKKLCNRIDKFKVDVICKAQCENDAKRIINNCQLPTETSAS
jgi:hypothetical protein